MSSNSMVCSLAKSFGMTTFIGSPCRVCSKKVRSVSETMRCVECHRKQSKTYSRLNSVKCNQKSQEWATANAEYRKNAREAKR